jgi:hypothetical protein
MCNAPMILYIRNTKYPEHLKGTISVNPLNYPDSGLKKSHSKPSIHLSETI